MSEVVGLKESHVACKEIARREAKHFYYGFLFLPREKRQAMFAIYAFMRLVDDAVDIPGKLPPEAALEEWRQRLQSIYSGKTPEGEIFPAFAEAVRQFQIPKTYFDLLLEGVAMDLQCSRYTSFEELRAYCYRVGSIVGLTTLCVLEGHRPEIQSQAESLGIAFQLTNILRDVRVDAEMGRIYLPQEDLRRLQVSEDSILQRRSSDEMKRLIQFEWERAARFYDEAHSLVPQLRKASSRRTISVLRSIYFGLFQKIRSQEFEVFSSPIKLSKPQKWSLALRGLLCPA